MHNMGMGLGTMSGMESMGRDMSENMGGNMGMARLLSVAGGVRRTHESYSQYVALT
jgi:hypothetical protein